ncbi:integral membrane protein GPR155-like [Oppia nitens]|uniref:integral membrane protein GPR155-like n=1 Tax=Oppia nitens TaxID=1686743 RepID=UPI0023D9829C|nr:integral membrane protein GPR155-like [Oppia nitens]
MSDDMSILIGVSDLASVLLQCFILILMGYMSCRLELTAVSESGLSSFVTYFALPALIFKSLSTSDLSDINWYFVISILISKTVIFVLVVIITAVLTKPLNLTKSGLFGIFSTQSNDFALGYPLLTSLYGKTHPQFAGYLYVLAPIQLVFLNPLGLIIIEIDKQLRRQRLQINNFMNILINVMKQIVKNPIILMTTLGIVWNITFGNKLPDLLIPLLDVMSNAFSATALFLLGTQLVGKLKIFTSSSYILLVSLVLVMTKILILPLLNRVIIQNIMDSHDNQTSELSNFGFLYGTFPSAPTAFLFALQYDSGIPSTILSAGMVMSTVLSAPLMFVSANMIRMSANASLPYTAFHSDLGQTMTYSGLVSAFCLLWTIFVLICGKKWQSLTHRCTIALAISQLMIAIGGYLWQYMDNSTSIQHFYLIYYLQYVFAVGGVLSARVWTAMLSITLALLYWKSLCYVIKIHTIMSYMAAIVTVILVLMVIYIPNLSNSKTIDPNFEFGKSQAYISVLLLICCLIITIVGLITQQHLKSKLLYNSLNLNSEDFEFETQESEHQVTNDTDYLIQTPNLRRGGGGRVRTFSNPVMGSSNSQNDNELVEVEDLLESVITTKEFCQNANCSETRRKSCISNIRKYRQHVDEANEVTPLLTNSRNDDIINENVLQFHQLSQHIFLLLTLLPSMLIGLTVSMGKLITERPTGIFIELEFLDILLNYGQGVITFLIFGLEMSPVFHRINILFRHQSYTCNSSILLPPLESIKSETKEICNQFNIFHKYNCINDLVFEHKVNEISYRVFRGNELVDWLIRAGISRQRTDAEAYGRHLLIGRVIRHFNDCQHFHDKTYFYRFNLIDS